MTRQALRGLQQWHLSPRRLSRQRRHRARQAGAHRGRGDDRRRPDDVRFHRHVAAGARAVQLHGVRALCRRVLRRAFGDGSARAAFPTMAAASVRSRSICRKGSLVNPREPAPTGCRTSTIKRITTCILGALRQAAPDRVPADSGSEIVIMHFGGQRSDGRRYVTSQLLVAGSGASSHLDGVDVIETDASNCLNVPAEALMMEAPIRVHRRGAES